MELNTVLQRRVKDATRVLLGRTITKKIFLYCIYTGVDECYSRMLQTVLKYCSFQKLFQSTIGHFATRRTSAALSKARSFDLFVYVTQLSSFACYSRSIFGCSSSDHQQNIRAGQPFFFLCFYEK